MSNVKMTPRKRILDEINAERERQIRVKGFDAKHDDCYQHFELARAASCYAVNPARALGEVDTTKPPSWAWPWEPKFWRPEGERSDLVKAAALIVAEIERMDRHAGKRAE